MSWSHPVWHQPDSFQPAIRPVWHGPTPVWDTGRRTLPQIWAYTSIQCLIMMKWFVRCIGCKNRINVDGVNWNPTNRIHLVCEKCNRRNTYAWTDRRTRVTSTLTIRYRIYKTKLYSDKKITAGAVATAVFSIIFQGLNILPFPLDLVVSFLLVFFAFELGSGRVKIEYSDEGALNSIRERYF